VWRDHPYVLGARGRVILDQSVTLPIAQDPEPQEDMDQEMEEGVVSTEESSSESEASSVLVIDLPTDGKRKFNSSSNEVVFTKPQVEKKIKANHDITPARPVTHVAVSPVYIHKTQTQSQISVTKVPETPPSIDWSEEVEESPLTQSLMGYLSPRSQILKEKREARRTRKKDRDNRSNSEGRIPSKNTI
jgi:hypothetical protein